MASVQHLAYAQPFEARRSGLHRLQAPIRKNGDLTPINVHEQLSRAEVATVNDERLSDKVLP